jgi:hypothetical protein
VTVAYVAGGVDSSLSGLGSSSSKSQGGDGSVACDKDGAS